MRLRIATRGSLLATTQSQWVADRLRALHPGLETELVIRKTRGDNVQDRTLLALSEESGVKGLFVREIQEAVLDGDADIAIHSMKDLPARGPEELALGAVPEREDARDALILPAGFDPLDELRDDLPLPPGARVGTASLRRSAQLRALRPDLQILDLRGNVDTRLRKLDEGEYDAIILAAAGMRRLGLLDRISAPLSPELCVPAPGQAALAVECRRDDTRTAKLLATLDHAPSRACVELERAVMKRLGGDCNVPLGCYAVPTGGSAADLAAVAIVVSPDGTRIARARATGRGSALADELIRALESEGARDILADLQAG